MYFERQGIHLGGTGFRSLLRLRYFDGDGVDEMEETEGESHGGGGK